MTRFLPVHHRGDFHFHQTEFRTLKLGPREEMCPFETVAVDWRLSFQSSHSLDHHFCLASSSFFHASPWIISNNTESIFFVVEVQVDLFFSIINQDLLKSSEGLVLSAHFFVLFCFQTRAWSLFCIYGFWPSVW